MVRFAGRLVAAELDNHLALFRDLRITDVQRLVPPGKPFAAPHFLAVHPRDGLLVSNGWGSSIVALPDLNGAAATVFSGPVNSRLTAPHGLCVDANGWIYVADSLNSRLVRFRNLAGRDWQVFADHQRQVAYGRQLVCRDDGLWLANSFEQRPGLNPGSGGTLLHIKDFASGEARVVARFDEKLTGIAALNDNQWLVGLWRAPPVVAVIDVRNGTTIRRITLPAACGVAYGISVLEDRQVVACLGTEAGGAGGLVVLN
ncbi:MAG: hypothetical protein LJE84_08995 [Gammaproteobacteria bacterium]|nr:hypothetical protein [Gammaproteobacteria bacterium]